MARRIALVAAVAFVLVGLSRLRFDTDVLGLLPAELPEVRGLSLYQRHFRNAGRLLVTIAADDPVICEAAAGRVAAVLAADTGRVASAMWRPPWAGDASALASLPARLWLHAPEAEVRRLAERLSPGGVAAAAAAARDALETSLSPAEVARAAADPLGLTRVPGLPGGGGFEEGGGVFASADGRFRLVHVDPASPPGDYREAGARLEAVRGPALRAAGEGVAVGFTGGPVFASEIAAGMERDMKSSLLTTVAAIALLFRVAHRSLKPLLRLVGLLAATLAITLALAGWAGATLNVVSLGFAAVLLGLVADYGLILHQERAAEPTATTAEIRGVAMPGILWSAATTAGTFALLRFSGLPGLGELGALVATGLCVGAVVMLLGMAGGAAAPARIGPGAAPSPLARRVSPWAALSVPLLAAAVVCVRGWPEATSSPEPLRPRGGGAYRVMEELRRRMGSGGEPLLVLAGPGDAPAVGRSLERIGEAFDAAAGRGAESRARLPGALWPRPDRIGTNLSLLSPVIRDGGAAARDALVAAGFTGHAFALAGAIISEWRGAAEGGSPQDEAGWRWISSQFMAMTAAGPVGLGWVEGPPPDAGTRSRIAEAGGILTGWDLLGAALLRETGARAAWLTAGLVAAMALLLRLALGGWRESALALGALATAGLLLSAVMSLAGWRWNLMNLIAAPLLLGISVDSTIHVQLALRRHRGDRGALWRSTGKALCLCAGANFAGFASLAWSSNAGLASLDSVCAVGVACVLVVALGCLPAWWTAAGCGPGEVPAAPAAAYRARWWRAGLAVARRVPGSGLRRVCRAAALVYAWASPGRRAVVEANLLPVLGGDRRRASEAAWENFAGFGEKLADLWRFESGADVAGEVVPGPGWEHYRDAVATGRGLLLATPHLGNWEFGAPMLRAMGRPPLVLTAAEPGGGFTDLRRDARAAHGIETLVVGDDPFAFVQAIRRLQDGGTVALLVDRPPAGRAAATTLFGRPYAASASAAELARATGCVVLPVAVLRRGQAYVAHALEPVGYDRRALGDRAARAEFAGRLLRAFEPLIREHPGQWFHFVPVWTPPGGEAAGDA